MSEQNYNEGNNGRQNTQGTTNSQVPHDDNFDYNDIERNKTIAGLAYILFFLPLIICPESKFGKFHANQALLLLIVAIAGNIILGMIPFIGWMLMPLFGFATFIIGIIGIVNGLGGKVKRLPIFGQYNIIK